MTTKWNGPDFPGAYSGKVRSWERKKREEIGLLPDKHGFSPGIVLGDKPAETIMATAVKVPQCERQLYGSSYIGVMEGKMITPRKLASSLNVPWSAPPSVGRIARTEQQAEVEEEEEDNAPAPDMPLSSGARI